MSVKFEKATVGEKLSEYLVSMRTIILAVIVTAAVFVIGFSVVVTFISKSNAKGLSAIDSITYALTQNSSEISEEQLESRRAEALRQLEMYLSGRGITAVRANMLAAEIENSRKNYESAARLWVAAASKASKSYTSPLAYFNAASAYENLNDFENAEKYYNLAVKFKDFLLINHALFSLGRVREMNGNTKEAIEAYKTLFDKSPDDTWAELAKSRLLILDETDLNTDE